MELRPHPRARERLVDRLAAPGPSLTLVRGPAGVGRTTLLRSVLDGGLPSGTAGVRHLCLPLPDPDQRSALLTSLVRDLPSPLACGDADSSAAPPPEWDAILEALADRVDRDRTPLAVVLDDVQHLLTADRDAGPALEAFWGRLRARALPVHLVLAGRTPEVEEALDHHAPELQEVAEPDLALEPAGLREVAELVPDYSARDRVRTWAVFGGMPGRLRHLDPAVTLATNVRRLVLEPDAPFLRAGLEALEGDVQSLPRYVTLLRGLANGARDWGELRRECPDFGTGSQMAPYVARLESLRLVDVRRSLDAAPRSRNRRYELGDPFLAFWYRLVFPLLTVVELGDPGDLWTRAVKPGLDAHVRSVLPRGCRGWLLRHGDEALPERARIVGGLWGDGYDLETSGTFRHGATFYGTTVWADEPADAPRFEELYRQLRRTRYGFGREARHRLLFSAGGFTAEARRVAARDPWVHGLDLGDVLGR